MQPQSGNVARRRRRADILQATNIELIPPCTQGAGGPGVRRQYIDTWQVEADIAIALGLNGLSTFTSMPCAGRAAECVRTTGNSTTLHTIFGHTLLLLPHIFTDTYTTVRVQPATCNYTCAYAIAICEEMACPSPLSVHMQLIHQPA